MTKGLAAYLKNKPAPNKSNIISVYSIITFMVYSWTLMTFFYTLPSWVKYLTVKEIGILFAYAMSVDLLESIFILGVIICIYFILPKFSLREDFAIHGAWLAISCLGMIMTYFIPFFGIKRWISNPGVWLIFSIILAVFCTITFSRWKSMKFLARFLLDRMPVFLVIFLPISAISLLIVSTYLLF